MGKTREEFAREQNEAATKAGQEFADAQRADAEEARGNAPDAAETEEEYHARLQGARTSGIFGDTDTTAGSAANVTQVPSADNEAATVATAQADAAEEGSEEAAASDDEARRQVDVSAGQPSAEEVDAGAEDQADENAPAGDSTDAGPASDAGQEAGGSEEAPNADAVVEDAQPNA